MTGIYKPITAILFALVMAASLRPAAPSAQNDRYLDAVDHLMYATPDLDVGIASIEKLLGVRATIGGQHMGFGTRNALISLGPLIYLEIIGPDPGQPHPAGPRRYGIDDLKEPKLIAWVSRATGLDALVTKARASGIALGDALSGNRQRPDGSLLRFGYTDPSAVVEHRLIPYFMDWGESPHPATTSPKGARLVSLRLEDPDPARIQRMLGVLGLTVPITRGPAPMIIAVLEGTKDRVELRGAQ